HRPDANGFAHGLSLHDIVQKIGRHAAKLMLLPIEIGLVYGEGIYEILDLVIGVRPEQGKVGLEAFRTRRGYTFLQPAVDVISFVFGETHAGPAIKEIAKTTNVLLPDSNGGSPRSFGTRHTGL